MPIVIPSPSAGLRCRNASLASGTVLHRIHEARFGPAEFNPGFGASRFAPLSSGGAMVPTAYAATSFECALFETLFHDIDPVAPFKTVPWSSVAKLVHSTLSLRRSVDLAALFSSDLMKLGLSRTHLIDTPSSRYAETRCWSEALHGCADRPEGMMWTSRAYDQGTALVLFGDRINVADLTVVGSRPMATHPDCLAEMLHQADMAGITIVR